MRKFIEFVRNKIITRRGGAPGTITKIMAKYILSKKAKGKKYQYTVTDGRGIKNLLKQIPMRFALRKQEKIKAYFEPNGDEMLNRIKESLTRYFSADRSDFPEGFRDIESDYNQLPGEPYPTIAINDVGNDDRMIEFYVTGKQYDVYHVAFKGFTKG